ncbi:hypothetical protein D0463_16305, partial [Bacillus sp. V59.32b]
GLGNKNKIPATKVPVPATKREKRQRKRKFRQQKEVLATKTEVPATKRGLGNIIKFRQRKPYKFSLINPPRHNSDKVIITLYKRRRGWIFV